MRATPVALLAVLLFVCGCNNDPWQPGESGQNAVYDTFGDITSFDPSVSYSTDDGVIIDLIYPSFFRYRYPAWKTNGIELDVGAEQPKVEDGTFAYSDGSGPKTVKGERWTFRIRHDIDFQDDPCFPRGKGRHVTANDIAYAFKRMADPKTVSPLSDFVADKIVGWKEYQDGFATRGRAHYKDPIPGVQWNPSDPYTLRIVLNQPYPQLRYLMCMHFTTPIPREAVEMYGDAFSNRHPVGCGGFMVQELRPRDRLVLVRNPNCKWSTYPTGHYPDDDPSLLAYAGRRVPFIDKIAYLGVRETLTAYNLFQQGYIDQISAGYSTAQIVRGATGLSPEMKTRGMRLVDNVWCGYFYIAFNMDDATFGGYTESHRKLRQAISLAIDSNAYIQIVCQGMGKKAEFCLPPSLFGFDPDYRNPYRAYEPSLARAKQLLTEAGFPNGVDPATGQKLVLHFDNYSTSPATRQLIRLFQIQIERLGIHVDLRSTTYELYKDKIHKRQVQMFFGSWTADYPDPENFLSTMYGPNGSPGANESNYESKQFDRLFERMRSMRDGPERLALIRQMREIVEPDCPLIALSYGESRSILSPWLTNVQPQPISYQGTQYVRVDPAARVAAQAEWNRPRVWPLVGLVVVAVALVSPSVLSIQRHRRRKVRVSK